MPCSQPAALPSPGSWKRPRPIPSLREQLRDKIECIGFAQPRPTRPPTGLHRVSVVELPDAGGSVRLAADIAVGARRPDPLFAAYSRWEQSAQREPQLAALAFPATPSSFGAFQSHLQSDLLHE